MDGHEIASIDLFKNYRELHWVNRFLGGYKASLFGVKIALKNGNIRTLIDIGCGGGDSLAKIKKTHAKLNCKGIDIAEASNEYCIQNHPELEFITADYNTLKFSQEETIIHTALFNHHLNPAENVLFLKWAKDNAAYLIINDLQRSFAAWLGIYLIKQWPWFSYLFKNDAPLSVKRAHSKTEWIDMLKSAGITNYTLYSKPMYRFVIVCTM
jgi:2-polyprenyl-3-methyl-5-hydroxy-6-metoxy-1,4-benzoquinol methylase